MHPSFANVIKRKESIKNNLNSIKHKIGIYSAKGGVGKTTTAINIAYTLSKRGFKVGLLDADIDCPNLTVFLGITDMMNIEHMPLIPLIKDGIKIASTAMLVDDTKKPIIWRGPIIVKMLYDFFENTEWGELDYLIIDLPPGTSDAPLTIMQVLDMDGFIIVTTDHKIGALNSVRSGLMAKRLGKSIIGIIANMTKENGTSEHVNYVCANLGVELLGSIPFDKNIEDMSNGSDVAVLNNQKIYELYANIVEKVIS
jgi:ATP-binding protein involved in chromosome partitioning